MSSTSDANIPYFVTILKAYVLASPLSDRDRGRSYGHLT